MKVSPSETGAGYHRGDSFTTQSYPGGGLVTNNTVKPNTLQATPFMSLYLCVKKLKKIKKYLLKCVLLM